MLRRAETAIATLSYCGEQVRQLDPDRFLCALFAPVDRREDMFALYAFNLEIARVREQVSEPMLGRIRLQWWREAIEGIYGGTPRRHEVIQPLQRAIARHALGRAPLERMIEAREIDMDGEPPADMAALEAYAEASAGTLSVLALDILGVAADAARGAAREVGIAWSLTGLLRATAFHANARRIYLPLDLLQRHGLSADDVFALQPSAALARVGETVADAARSHLAAARELRSSVPRAALPVLLPARLADGYLRVLARAGYDPLAPVLVRPLPHAAAKLTVSALFGRY